jgi:hypothetical protein
LTKESGLRKRNRVSLTKCDEPFDNTLNSILTLYVPVSDATHNDLVEAEVAPEDEAGTPEDVEEEDIVQADAQNSTEEKVPLDKGEPTQEEDSGKLDEMS